MLPSAESERLRALLEGRLESGEQAALEAELEASARLRDLLAELSGETSFTGEFVDAVRGGPASGRERLRDLIEHLKSRAEAPAAGDEWRELVTVDPARPDLLGRIGGYEILRLVAAGGMGMVFQARDPKLGRLVALKALTPALAATASARERFTREARAVAAVEHPNVLPIFGIHDGGGACPVPWFAMTWADGGSLEELLEKSGGKLPFDRVLGFAKQIAAALEAAHAKGLVHRDIKPANILLDAAGERLWVADFGIARSADDPALTYSGHVAGTPEYMAPEQTGGGEPDARSDWFSFGTLLYRCVTGRLPFEAATSTGVMQAVREAEPLSIGNAAPRWFRRLAENLLEKDPRHRMADGRSVRQALEKRKAPRPVRRRRRWIAAGALAALVLTAAAMLQVPAAAYRLNRWTAGSRPFVSASRLGCYDQLSEAVAAARPGDTIEVLGSGGRTIRPVVIPPGKPLVIRAEAGARPVFRSPDASAPALRIESPLRLEGLTILRSDPRREGEPLVDLRAGSLTLDGCSLNIALGVSERTGRHPMIRMRQGTTLEARHSCLFAIGTMTVKIDGGDGPGSRVKLDHSFLAGHHGIGLGGALDLEMERCAVFGDSFLVAPGPLQRLSCRSRASSFAIRRGLMHFVSQPIPALQEQVSWDGEGNLFFDGGSMLLQFRGGTSIPDLAGWKALPFVRETGTGAVFPGTEVFARHGMRVEVYTPEVIGREVRRLLDGHPAIGPGRLGPP
jgi:hypothetical protein